MYERLKTKCSNTLFSIYMFFGESIRNAVRPITEALFGPQGESGGGEATALLEGEENVSGGILRRPLLLPEMSKNNLIKSTRVLRQGNEAAVASAPAE